MNTDNFEKNQKYIKNYYFYQNKEILNLLENFSKETLAIDNKKFVRIVEYLSNNIKTNINFKELTSIKNEYEYVIVILNFLIIKSITENQMIMDHTIKGHSDDLMNKTIENFKNFLIWLDYKKKIKFSISNKKLRFLIGLCFINLSNKKKILNNKIFINKKSYTCYTIDHIEIKENFYIATQPYEIFENKEKNIYIIGIHFSTITDIQRSNIFSDKGVEFVNKEILEKILNYWVYLDLNYLKYSYDCLLKKNKLSNKDLNDTYKTYIIQLRNFLEQNDINAIKEISKKISEINLLKDLKELTDLKLHNIKIYFPFIFDFRGRLYYLSKVSPTFNKFLRNCIHCGPYENNNTSHHIYNEIIENELEKHLILLNDLKILTNDKLKKNEKYSIIWILISIAETEKMKLGESVNIQQFIKKGIEIANNFDSNYNDDYDIEKFLKIKYLINTLIEINNNIFIKRLISKDATASVYQHLIKILGHKDIEALEWCNLSSKDTWYDTYSYIIKLFKKQIKSDIIDTKEIDKIFYRKSLKKTIMTSNYGSSLLTCWHNFIDEIKYDEYPEEKKNEIKKIFIKFYNFIQKENNFFKNKSENIYDNLKKTNYTVSIKEDVVISLIYKKLKTKQIELYINKKRFTKQEKFLDDSIDEKKIKTSIRANYVHSLDAALVRWLLKQIKIITIHDCFMIDYLNITYLISKVNEGMRISFHDLYLEKQETSDNLFSIFIIL